MEGHEREYLVSKIRMGCVIDRQYKILPFSLLDIISSKYIYEESYKSCLDAGLMTQQETLEWAEFQGLWSDEQDDLVERSEKDIEEMKLKIFEDFFIKKKRDKLKNQKNSLQRALNNLYYKKSKVIDNCAESLAEQDRLSWLIKKSVKLSDKNFDIEQNSHDIITKYRHDTVAEDVVRDLARNEPWRTFWTIAQKEGRKFFKYYKDRDYTYNQKNLMIWSITYDNIQESLDCPSEDIINDDDALDGWFISQRRKREKEKNEKKWGDSKHSNATDIFIMSDEEEAKDIYSINSPESLGIIRERQAALAQKGSLKYEDVPDLRRDIIKRQMEGIKNHG